MVECRTTNMGNTSTVPHERCLSSKASGVLPHDEEECKLGPCSSFRLVNRITVQKQWYVTEIRFYVDDACTQAIHGVPFSAGYCSTCECKNATGYWGGCTPELAFDGHVPYFDPGGKLAAGTAWISQCGNSGKCGSGKTWLGVHTDGIVNVRCIRIMQSGDKKHAASEVALEAFDRSSGTWIAVSEWAGVELGRWVPLIVQRACSNLLDCLDKGAARGLPGQCVCTCFQGFTGLSCQYCAVGYEGYPDCRSRYRQSDGWRLMALEVPLSKTWHVSDMTLHTDLSCSDESKLSLSSIQEFLGSYDGKGEGDLALGPERVFDAAGEATTWISSKCAGDDLESCPNGAPWVGVRLSGSKAVSCVRLRQGHSDFAVDSIALDLWNSSGVSGGYWYRVRSWTNILLERQADGYSQLRLVCNDGIPVGTEILQNCDTEKLPWESCEAWCREGYSGMPETFLCWDTYAFRGVLPTCEPVECTQGIPSGEGVSVDECLGKKTDERCKATCGSGFVGASVSYFCSPDGTWREERTGATGVMPACTEGITPLTETVSQAIHTEPNLLHRILIGLLVALKLA